MRASAYAAISLSILASSPLEAFREPVALRGLLGHDALNLGPHRGAGIPAYEANPHAPRTR
jgi:hypothetical protein